ncbi:MAG: family 43 glycosylhydrolase [Turicibacter sp.]|nr:family 43 glycosylhydrolase [Turicibacter sp.]
MQVFNPFLPSFEYVPDGEPRVFGDRLYLFGSHDAFDGEAYCPNDYVCWSAPVDDLSNWCFDGTIYKKTQDPNNPDGNHHLYAPDLIKGVDGRFYLYYSLPAFGVMSVAVSATPAGEYEFYGFVKDSAGNVLKAENSIYHFDPGVFVDDDERIFLYSGFAPRNSNPKTHGSFVMELERDMLTVKSDIKPLLPTTNNSHGTGFEGHEFFEASSVRKVNDTYYLVYSSINSHELCYATSAFPDRDFSYGGVLVSIGDLSLNGRTEPLNYLGNTHGSLVEVGGVWYVFYHRQTNLHQFSRQACAERIHIAADGTIKQAELTSCGLNGGTLLATGEYEARIACNLRSKDGATFYSHKERMPPGEHPYFTQSGSDRESDGDQYIANFGDGAMAGFKYFDFLGKNTSIAIKMRGRAKGVMVVCTIDETELAKIEIDSNDLTLKHFSAKMPAIQGKKPLYFTFHGTGVMDFISFELT